MALEHEQTRELSADQVSDRYVVIGLTEAEYLDVALLAGMADRTPNGYAASVMRTHIYGAKRAIEAAYTNGHQEMPEQPL